LSVYLSPKEKSAVRQSLGYLVLHGTLHGGSVGRIDILSEIESDRKTNTEQFFRGWNVEYA
jgi:hypothetical protein